MTVTVTYDVLVNNNVVIGQALTNSATARWTSLDGDFAYERSGTGVAPNGYVASDSTTLIIGDSTTFVKVRASDTYTAADANVRIGDLIEYELQLGLQEGTHTNISVTDTLPTGLQYVGMVSAIYFGTPGTATPVVGGQTLTWTLGTVTNPSDGNPNNDVLVLRYRARVLNNDVFAQTPTSQALTNNATLGYTVAGNAVTRPSTASVTVLQPY
jgi:fimbrial isopeptide formation D2 family protein